MKIAVIGSSGFLGRRAAEYFEKTWDVLTPSHGELDITAQDSVQRYLEKEQPEAVIQCAAVSDTGKCAREPEKSRKINVDGSVHVAKIAGELGAKCILCSSDQVYFGSAVTEPHLESEKLEPGNEYGRQKLEMENQALGANPDCVLLRLSWMYDEIQRPGEHGSFMVKLLEDLRKGREMQFPIHDKRGITHVDEVVQNLGKALNLPGGVYNFGATNNQSTYCLMADIFARTVPAALPLLQKNTAAFADAPRNLTMNMDKLGAYGITFSPTAERIEEILKGWGEYQNCREVSYDARKAERNQCALQQAPAGERNLRRD